MADNTAAREGAGTPARKPCRICGEPIAAAARKCIHCGSWQVWWRSNFGLTSEVLAMIVALVSVIATGGPLLVKALTPQNSSFVLSVSRFTHLQFAPTPIGDFSAFVSNSGTRPGLLRSAVWIHLKDATGKVITLPPHRVADVTGEIIEAGTSKYLTFAFEFDRQDWKDFQPTQCAAEFRTTDFSGTDQKPNVPFDCEKLYPLFNLMRRAD